MNILSSQQIREADQFTIENEPISSINLMERASSRFSELFIQKYPVAYFRKVCVVCGPGNNGGDGLAIARILHSAGYSIFVFIFEETQYSQDFRINLERLEGLVEVGGITDDTFSSGIDFHILIDAIFGSGLNREITGIYKNVIEKINSLDCIKVSVDIPSGLSADEGKMGVSIQSDYCISFQVPKLSFYLHDSENTYDELDIIDIGLDKMYIESQKSPYFLVDRNYFLQGFKPRLKFSHKGNYGHVLITGGSPGMMGAVYLSAKASLRTGSGLVTCYIPKSGLGIIQSSLPEVMALTDDAEYLTHPPELSRFSAIGIGPGMSTKIETVKFIRSLFENFHKPVVIDADALNLISENQELLKLIPVGSVLTPHPGEFKRLVGGWKNDLEKISLQRAFSEKNQCIVVVKGHHTTIT
ncbi:MAG: NAD(P)H-hydrate epimerase, partial [Cyclobacteriaceae bacterium]|nr:NAD(P)H-hydrate epimerase [Cyclobacteriaceae bacterium]